jgi:hypothetical protein
MRIGLIVVVLSVLLALGNATPGMQLVSGDCVVRNSQGNFQLHKLPQSELTIVSVIDCALPGGMGAYNKLLGTTGDKLPDCGVYLDVNDNNAVLFSVFDTMYSTKFCGSKAADYSVDVCNNIVVGLSAIDLEDALIGYDQIFRRVLNRMMKNKDIKLNIVIANDGTIDNGNELTAKVQNMVNILWSDLSPVALSSTDLENRPNMSIHIVSLNEEESTNLCRNKIMSNSESSTVVSSSNLGSLLSDSWRKIGSNVPRAILTPGQRRSLYIVDQAYTNGMTQLESVISQFRSRVGQGKLVGKFNDRVQKLHETVQKAFYDATQGCIMVKERAERAQLLSNSLATSTSNLFRQQLSLAQVKITAEFKDELIKIAQKDSVADDEEQQALRKSLFNFRTMIADLEVDIFGLSANEFNEELSTSLQTILTEFPESPAAKLEAARKMEKAAKKPRKKKGERAVNIGLNLVGMLRPPGYGNLQGFCGYSTGLFGLPFDIMLGVQNDGDSPEIMGEDREYPILRLQPKVHFDVDL